jgi:hypothetical protein
VKNGTLCLEINEKQKLHTFIMADTNMMVENLVIQDNEFNMWPNNTCSDRNKVPLGTVNHVDYYFNGTIDDPAFLIGRKIKN